MLGHLIAALDERIQVRLLGVDADVLRRIASRRPGTAWRRVPPIKGSRDLANIWAHRRAMAQAHPDLVQINLPVPHADPYTVLSALTLSRVPVIAVQHLPMATPWPRVQRLMRFAATRLTTVSVSSGAARQIERLLDIPGTSIRVVPNGVPEPEDRKAVPAQPGRLVVGAVGRLHEQKGFDVLLRAVTGLPEVQVVIIGEGPERPALQQLIAELHLGDRVSLLGWSDHASGYMRSFDVLAMPSRYEGMPLVLLEAMLAGVPVVATPVGGIPDTVRHDESGLLVPVDDVAALTTALGRLLSDGALRRRLAAAAEDEARRRHTVDAMARSYEALYDELLSRGRRR